MQQPNQNKYHNKANQANDNQTLNPKSTNITKSKATTQHSNQNAAKQAKLPTNQHPQSEKQGKQIHKQQI